MAYQWASVTVVQCRHTALGSEDNPGFDKNKLLIFTPADPTIKYYDVDYPLPDNLDSNEMNIYKAKAQFEMAAMNEFLKLPEVKQSIESGNLPVKGAIGFYIPGTINLSIPLTLDIPDPDPNNPCVCPQCKQRGWLKFSLSATPPVSVSYDGEYIITPRWKQFEEYKQSTPAYFILEAWERKTAAEKENASPDERAAYETAVKLVGKYYELFKLVKTDSLDSNIRHEMGHETVAHNYLTTTALPLLWAWVSKRVVGAAHFADKDSILQDVQKTYNELCAPVDTDAWLNGIGDAGNAWDDAQYNK